MRPSPSSARQISGQLAQGLVPSRWGGPAVRSEYPSQPWQSPSPSRLATARGTMPLSFRFCCHPHSTNCKHQQRHLELAITPFATAPLLCRLALDWQLISAIRLLSSGRCLPGAKPYAPALPTWTYWWYAAMASLGHAGHATTPPSYYLIPVEPRPLILSCPISPPRYISIPEYKTFRIPPRRRTWVFEPSFNGWLVQILCSLQLAPRGLQSAACSSQLSAPLPSSQLPIPRHRVRTVLLGQAWDCAMVCTREYSITRSELRT